MRTTLSIVACMLALASEAMAGSLTITGTNGQTTVGAPYTGVVNRGSIIGGSGTGLTVTGPAARSVVNQGRITGTTGLRVTGGSSSSVVNKGTISATSVGSSSARAVGVSQ